MAAYYKTILRHQGYTYDWTQAKTNSAGSVVIVFQKNKELGVVAELTHRTGKVVYREIEGFTLPNKAKEVIEAWAKEQM